MAAGSVLTTEEECRLPPVGGHDDSLRDVAGLSCVTEEIGDVRVVCDDERPKIPPRHLLLDCGEPTHVFRSRKCLHTLVDHFVHLPTFSRMEFVTSPRTGDSTQVNFEQRGPLLPLRPCGGKRGNDGVLHAYPGIRC